MGNRLQFGFPEKLICKLRYVDHYALQISSGSIAKQVMYLNSTFDPDNTGTGHQPMYRDQYAAIYDQYAVIRTKAVVKFINTDTDTIIVCGMVIDDDNSTSASVTTLCEQSQGQYTILPPLAGSLSSHTFNWLWDCKKHLGIDPFTSQTYKTAVGSNPSEVTSLLIWASNFDASTLAVTIEVTLEQEVLWTELTTPTGS
jgi:hypothetical protein